MIINDQYKISSDSLNVILYQKKINKENGNPRWEAIAYFAEPKNALKYLVTMDVMTTGMKDLETVVKKIDELEKVVNRLRGLPEVRRNTQKPAPKRVESLTRQLIPMDL